MRSATCSASSRYWVVSSTVRAALGELLDLLATPRSWPAG